MNQTYLKSLVEILHSNLLKSPKALLYLKTRNVLGSQVLKFHIGYHNADLVLPKIPVTTKQEDDPWLAFYRWAGGHNFYKLRECLVFPIYDIQDQIIGFTSRSIEGKYFSKFFFSRGHYFPSFLGLSSDIKPFEDKVFLTEGVFDFLSLQQIYPNTLCSMTANVSNNQIELFYAIAPKTIIILFDNDSVGARGAQALTLKLNKAAPWINVDVWKYPEKDLADFLDLHGLSKFEAFFKLRDLH